MFDRVRIWGDDSGYVHFEVKDANNVPFIHTAMPAAEWYQLRSKQIDSYPPDVSVSVLTDLVTVLSVCLETA